MEMRQVNYVKQRLIRTWMCTKSNCGTKDGNSLVDATVEGGLQRVICFPSRLLIFFALGARKFLAQALSLNRETFHVHM